MKMFLSQLILNDHNRQVRSEITRPYELHVTLLRCFPCGNIHLPRQETESSGVLYRLDEHPHTGTLTLLVQSQTEPDWRNLEDNRDGRGQPYLLTPADTKPAEPVFRPQQELRFRLRANPTKRLSAGKSNKGRRVGLYTIPEQITWLERKAVHSGFAIDSVLPSMQRRQDDQARQLKFLSVQFDGILQVTDPAAFLAAIQSGIGSGKAFGFGLLSVAPVP